MRNGSWGRPPCAGGQSLKEVRGRGHFGRGDSKGWSPEGVACVAELGGMRGKVAGGEDRG